MRTLFPISLIVIVALSACTSPAPAAPTQVAPAATSAAAIAPTVVAAAKPAATAVAQAAPTVAAAAASAATAVAKPAGAPVTITFWHGMNGTEAGTQGGTLKELVDQYKQVAPNVTINLDFTPYTANELQQKVTGAIVARNTPDLVQAFESDVAASRERAARYDRVVQVLGSHQLAIGAAQATARDRHAYIGAFGVLACDCGPDAGALTHARQTAHDDRLGHERRNLNAEIHHVPIEARIRFLERGQHLFFHAVAPSAEQAFDGERLHALHDHAAAELDGGHHAVLG